jgi:hypothetical protein
VTRFHFIPLVAGLFGHRHSGEPLIVTWFNAAAQWMGAHATVLAVVLPVLGLIVAGIVNHYLAVARDNRVRRLGRGETRARVHADLAARLLSHCSYIQGAIADPQADPKSWRPGNASLRARAEMADVVDVLGREYVSFMAAIEKERRAIDALAENGRRSDRIGLAARDVIETYAPFISDFGEARQAQRLLTFVGSAVHRA